VGHRRGPHDRLWAALAASAKIIQQMPCHLAETRVGPQLWMDRMAVTTSAVRVSFDPEADAAYVWLREGSERGRVARTAFCDIELHNAAINVDFDDQGRVVGFEILGARQLLPQSLLE
jgi:uncharacterized protein YuzE